jgi:hypothetical protein
MLPHTILRAVFLATAFWTVDAVPRKTETSHERVGTISQTAVRQAAPVVTTIPITVDGNTVLTNTTGVEVEAPLAAAAVSSTSVKSTVLVFARDAASGYSAYSGLNGIGIPYQLVIVPQAGITLPALNSSSTVGNYGAIVILSEVSYDYGDTLGFQSALSTAQWAALYQYQVIFGVRMVRLDAFPGPAFGTSAIGGCCNGTVEQLVSISDISSFPTSGLKM